MNVDVLENSNEFQKSHSIWNLGYLLQFLKLGMSRSEVENLLGKPEGSPPFGAGSLYAILDLRSLVDVDSGESPTMPVYLQVEFEGDNERWEVSQASDNPESSNQGELSKDKLLAFAILPIGE